MIIKLEETIGAGSSILADLAEHENIESYLKAIIAQKTSYIPVDCNVNIDSETFNLVYCGRVNNDVAQVFRKLARVAENRKLIPNDTTEIIADIFEMDLYIKL